jgi:hypothetical protein
MKVASVAEIDRDWSLEDVLIANELLDELEHVEAEAIRKARESHG